MKYAESISKLEQSRKWAARQYEEAVRCSTSRRPHRGKRDDDESARINAYEVDEENMFEFLVFKEQRLAEEREAQLQMQLELKRLQEQKQAGIEAVKRKMIEEEAILMWKKTQEIERRKEEEERQKRNAFVGEKLRQELERLKIPEEQIEKAIYHAAMEESSDVAWDRVGSSSMISGFKTKKGRTGLRFRSLLGYEATFWALTLLSSTDTKSFWTVFIRAKLHPAHPTQVFLNTGCLGIQLYSRPGL